MWFGVFFGMLLKLVHHPNLCGGFGIADGYLCLVNKVYDPLPIPLLNSNELHRKQIWDFCLLFQLVSCNQHYFSMIILRRV